MELDDLVENGLSSINHLKVRDGNPQHWAVLNAPAIAALHSVLSIPANDQLIHHIHRLRGFDFDWFNVANAVAMQAVVEFCNAYHPHYFRQIYLRQQELCLNTSPH